MVNFTPPIKAALFISIIYLFCFQLFAQSGNYIWLYPANVVFFFCSVFYTLFLNKNANAKLNMFNLTGRGIKFSFVSSLITFSGAGLVFFINYYLFPGSKISHTGFNNVKESFSMVFANSFLINFVFGSLGAFFTAGLMNEKNYQSNSKTLSSL